MQNVECFKLFHYARHAKQSERKTRRNKGSGWPICANTVMIAPKQSKHKRYAFELEMEGKKDIAMNKGRSPLRLPRATAEKWSFHFQSLIDTPTIGRCSVNYWAILGVLCGCTLCHFIIVELLSIDLLRYYFIWTTFLQFYHFNRLSLCHCVRAAVSSSEEIIFILKTSIAPHYYRLSFRILSKMMTAAAAIEKIIGPDRCDFWIFHYHFDIRRRIWKDSMKQTKLILPCDLHQTDPQWNQR